MFRSVPKSASDAWVVYRDFGMSSALGKPVATAGILYFERLKAVVEFEKATAKKLKLFSCPPFTTNMLDPKDPNLQPPTVLVMLPCYGGQMTVQTVESLLELQLEGYERGVDFIFVFDTKCSLISLGRSVMLSDVYNIFQDWTHILWVDADIGFTIDDFFKLLVADKDIVGGYYPLKSYPIKWASSPNKMNEGKEEGDLIETFYIATGFTLVKKQVIDKMLEHFKEEKDLGIGTESLCISLNLLSTKKMTTGS